MTCPRCSAQAEDGVSDCPSCGIIFAKWRAPRAATTPLPAEGMSGSDSVNAAAMHPATAVVVPWSLREAPPKPQPEYLGVTHAGWKAAAVGLALAGILTFFPFLSFILHPISTLVHEIGHTAMYWLFGYWAVPAFDFGEGGGVTMTDGIRMPSMIFAWVCGLAALGWWKRDNSWVLASVGGIVIVYWMMFGGLGEDVLICLGGHGGEVVFSAIFLYRALTGWGCKVEAERPLYAFLSFFILFGLMGLCLQLQSNTFEKMMYLEGKRGIDNDLVTGAQLLGWRLESVARAFILAAVAAIPLAFWGASIRKTIGAVSEAEEEV